MESDKEYPPPPPDADVIRTESGAILRELGGSWPEHLPYFEQTEPRSELQALDRTLAMLGIMQIHFQAPVEIIGKWIAENKLEASLSNSERRILTEPQLPLTKQQSIDLLWYVEALWAMAWAGSLISDIPIELPVGDNLASLLPDIRRNEGRAVLEKTFRLRPAREIYRKLDLYYLAHWYARDGNLKGYSTEPFNLSAIMERRKALQWLNDRGIADWDEISLDT